MKCPRLVLAGTHSGVGKTTVTLALLAALKARGRRVQAFKVGPDFIDPGHHAAITGRPSRNLDGWMLGPAESRRVFCRAAGDADVAVVEGMMGLFDGSSAAGDCASTAAAAKFLQAPVLLVIDGSGMARSAAAMAMGYARLDPELRVVGVLFNRISGAGHYRLLREAVEGETGLAVVGYLPPEPDVTIGDRHLGLVTALEQATPGLYERLARLAARTVDLDRVETLAAEAGELAPGSPPVATAVSPPVVRIGIAYDQAFCFYYAENLELLEDEGAELVRFSPIRDRVMPDCDLLYLGGGYPELHAAALSANATMRASIREFAARGGALYAECGGMMYLTEAIRDLDGRVHEMVGLFPAEAAMGKGRMTLGYREVEIATPCVLGTAGLKARGHEFHYSVLVPKGDLAYGCVLTDAGGERRGQDGLLYRNVVALYSHLHFGSQPMLARSLVAAARKGRVERTVSREPAP